MTIETINGAALRLRTLKRTRSTLFSIAAGALAALASSAALAGTLGVFTSDAKGFDTHTFYYDDGQEVTLIDTQFTPQLTKAMVDRVKSKTASPITRVIVTHPNPDKYNGLPYLHGLGVQSITSAAAARAMPLVHAYKENFWVNVAKAFKPGEYPAFENVKQTFTDKMIVRLKSGETLSLFELKNSGVSSKQLVVRIDRSGDLIVGDLVHTKAHLWLEGGLVDGKPRADLKRWHAAVAELPQLAINKPQAKIYGGRGEFALVADAVKEQQRYLTQAEALVKAYIDEASLGKNALTDPSQAAAHFKTLEQRFAAAFPDYALPYMVGYSVYGLLGSLLK